MTEPLRRLEELLTTAFSEDELRRLVYHLENGEALSGELPGTGVTHNELAHGVVALLERRNQIDAELLGRIVQFVPRRRTEVQEIARSLNLSLANVPEPGASLVGRRAFGWRVFAVAAAATVAGSTILYLVSRDPTPDPEEPEHGSDAAARTQQPPELTTKRPAAQQTAVGRVAVPTSAEEHDADPYNEQGLEQVEDRGSTGPTAHDDAADESPSPAKTPQTPDYDQYLHAKVLKVMLKRVAPAPKELRFVTEDVALDRERATLTYRYTMVNNGSTDWTIRDVRVVEYGRDQANRMWDAPRRDDPPRRYDAEISAKAPFIAQDTILELPPRGQTPMRLDLRALGDVNDTEVITGIVVICMNSRGDRVKLKSDRLYLVKPGRGAAASFDRKDMEAARAAMPTFRSVSFDGKEEVDPPETELSSMQAALRAHERL